MTAVEIAAWSAVGAVGLIVVGLIIAHVVGSRRVERAAATEREQARLAWAANCCCGLVPCPGQHVSWTEVERLRLHRDITDTEGGGSL